LANLYLHELDAVMRQAVRYADDAVALCRTREEAVAAFTRLRWLVAPSPPSEPGVRFSRGPAHGGGSALLAWRDCRRCRCRGLCGRARSSVGRSVRGLSCVLPSL